MKLSVRNLVPTITALIAVAALVYWLTAAPAESIVLRTPGLDKEGKISGPAVDLAGTLTKGPGQATMRPGSWPAFRGAAYNGISSENLPLQRSFAAGPRKLWEVKLGEGYAGPVVHNGRVYMIDYDEHAKMDVLRCWSLDDGKEIWSRAYKVNIPRNHGISRTVPAVNDKYVVSLGPKCHVICCDAVTGEFKWGMDMVRQFGTVVPPWYAGQCPIIEQDRVILAPGGSSLVIAVNIADGSIIWQTPNPRKWDMTHTTVLPIEFGGRRMYVYCGSGGVAGVDAATGQLLWDSTEWKITTAAVASPVWVAPDKLFLSGGYGTGAMMMQLTQQGDKIAAVPLYRLSPDVFGAEQQTPIHYQGHIYGVIPGGMAVCLDEQGKVKWTSGGRNRYGIAPYLIADGMLIFINDSGVMTLAEASPDKFKIIASVDLFEEGHEAWGPLAMAGGRLLVRDMTRMVCVDLKKETP
jgi:outer membrane protein assembly factor BamB